jgi:hypothetical protein
MSRPTKATVDYFPHYVNHGKTMFTLENKYGNDGYAFWFKILELMGGTEQHYINCNDVEMWEFLIAKTRVSEDIALDILNLLSRLGAINKVLWDNKIIRSDKYIENLDSVYKRREVNVISNEDVLSFCIQKPIIKHQTDNENPQSKVEDRKGKKRKEKNVPAKTQYADYVYLSLKEYDTLVNKYGEEATKWMIDKLDNAKGSKGYKYDSDYRAILNWVVDSYKDYQKRQGKSITAVKPDSNISEVI